MNTDRLDEMMRELVTWEPPHPVERRGSSIPDLLGAARPHRLIGVLAAAAESGSLPVDDEESAALEEAHLAAMDETLLLEDTLLEAIDVLGPASIDYRVLKGSALAHTVHPDPSERCFGDTDLLVPSGEVDRAVEALLAAGARRVQPPLSSDWDRRFAKSVTLAWRRGSELDVHRTLAPGAFGLRIDLGDLWAPADHFDLAGRQLDTFPPELHFANAIYHVALGDTAPRYGNLRDLVLMLRSGVDLDGVIELFERWRGRAVLEEALSLMGRVGVVNERLGHWVERHPPTRRDRSLIAAHRYHRDRFRRQAFRALLDLPWRDRPAYIRAITRRPRLTDR